MRKIISFVGFLLILLTLFRIPAAQAASGLPDSPQFGYGARIKLTAPPSAEAVQALARQFNIAAQTGLDWIALDFDWAQHAPTQAGVNLAPFDALMALATQNDLNVLVSITHAPGWSLGPSGPDLAATANLILTLARQYPGTLQAIECFPAANTAQGWGAPPDPNAYAQLLNSAHAALEANQMGVILIAAGLTPLSAASGATDIEDTVFLAGLYQAGVRENMPVISLRLPNLSGDPLSPIHNDGSTQLRHFESIRQVMLANGHDRGLLWITAFAWPAAYTEPQTQATWLVQAYELLQSHLYMGAAFFDSFNPVQNGAALIAANGAYHPGLTSLNKLIASRRSTPPQQITARKKMILRTDFKSPGRR
ncbi:MAG: hypothetical protein ACOYYS_25025 [Chloroflexota bacterium]